jgi:hypothetical protein
MKHQLLIVCLLLLATATSCVAITFLVLGEIRGDVGTTAGSVAVTAVGANSASWAKIGTGLSLSGGVLSSTAGTVPNFADAETPGGTINGTNAAFTLANAPSPALSLELYRNGLLQSVANGDYTLAGNTITFAAGAIPQTGDSLTASYRH